MDDFSAPTKLVLKLIFKFTAECITEVCNLQIEINRITLMMASFRNAGPGVCLHAVELQVIKSCRRFLIALLFVMTTMNIVVVHCIATDTPAAASQTAALLTTSTKKPFSVVF